MLTPRQNDSKEFGAEYDEKPKIDQVSCDLPGDELAKIQDSHETKPHTMSGGFAKCE